MKNFILCIFALALLIISGCTPPETVHIASVEKAIMGKIYHPRHGEGELFSIDSSLPPGFDRMLLDVLPFEHQLFRIVLEIDSVPGSADILSTLQDTVCKNFHIAPEKFLPGTDTRSAELPGTILTLRRAFHLGPRAVSLEIIDRKYSQNLTTLKNSDRYRIVREQQTLKNELRLIAQAIDGYQLDTGKFPENLSLLLNNRNNIPNWNGPYCSHLPPQISYRKISDTKYELFASSHGKKITEDSEL